MKKTILCAVILLSVASTAMASPFWWRDYTYDGSGNVTSAGSDRYVYDRVNRLVYADAGPQKYQEYTYDRYGNIRTIKTNGSAATQITIGVDPQTNRINGGNVSAVYDSAGRMTSSLVLPRAEYDGNDAVVETRIDSTTRRIHLYSATDDRVASIVVDDNGNEKSSQWTIRDMSGQILRRFDRASNGAWSWREDYIYRDGQLLAAEVDTPERTRHFHLDHLGTPRVITGSGGALVAEHTYHAFGTEATDPSKDTEARKFTGHERDAATLDYMHARYYNPAWGRFLSVDPTWTSAEPRRPQTWNRYAYAENSPVVKIDPDGRAAWFIGGLVGAGTSAAIEGGRQIYRVMVKREPVDNKKIWNAAVGGFVSGVTMSVCPTCRGAQTLAKGAVAGVTGGTTTRTLNGEKTTATDVVVDAGTGALGARLGEAMGGGLVASSERNGTVNSLQWKAAAQRAEASANNLGQGADRLTNQTANNVRQTLTNAGGSGGDAVAAAAADVVNRARSADKPHPQQQ